VETDNSECGTYGNHCALYSTNWQISFVITKCYKRYPAVGDWRRLYSSFLRCYCFQGPPPPPPAAHRREPPGRCSLSIRNLKTVMERSTCAAPCAPTPGEPLSSRGIIFCKTYVQLPTPTPPSKFIKTMQQTRKSRTFRHHFWRAGYVPRILWDHLGFWTFPSAGILRTRKRDVSETGSVSVLKCGGEDTYSAGSLRQS
jgi:hypothetical protein